VAVLSYPVALEGTMAMPGREGSVAAKFLAAKYWSHRGWGLRKLKTARKKAAANH